MPVFRGARQNKWMEEELILEGKVITAHKDKITDINTNIVHRH